MKDKRLHHHIHFNSDAQADIPRWQQFLPTWNGTAQLVDQQPTDAADVELYKNASGMLGCGGYFQGEWFHCNWQPHHQQHVSIQWQELFAIVAAALTWGHIWQQKCVRFYCDNLVIVSQWLKKKFTVFLKHLIGKRN